MTAKNPQLEQSGNPFGVQLCHQNGSTVLSESAKGLHGAVTEWCPSGAIDYPRPDRSLVELMRFRVPAFPLNDEETAECFGLEIARLLVDVYYRELRVERDAAEEAVHQAESKST